MLQDRTGRRKEWERQLCSTNTSVCMKYLDLFQNHRGLWGVAFSRDPVAGSSGGSASGRGSGLGSRFGFQSSQRSCALRRGQGRRRHAHPRQPSFSHTRSTQGLRGKSSAPHWSRATASSQSLSSFPSTWRALATAWRSLSAIVSRPCHPSGPYRSPKPGPRAASRQKGCRVPVGPGGSRRRRLNPRRRNHRRATRRRSRGQGRGRRPRRRRKWTAKENAPGAP
jgi:hypothetical protein